MDVTMRKGRAEKHMTISSQGQATVDVSPSGLWLLSDPPLFYLIFVHRFCLLINGKEILQYPSESWFYPFFLQGLFFVYNLLLSWGKIFLRPFSQFLFYLLSPLILVFSKPSPPKNFLLRFQLNFWKNRLQIWRKYFEKKCIPGWDGR